MPAPDGESAAQARAAIEAALSQIGFCLPGSITVLRTRCGKPRCACTAGPPSLHGPYIQWTRTVAGKTVTRRLTPAQYQAYAPWFARRPAAPHPGRRTASHLPERNGARRKLGQDHPRQHGAAAHPPRPGTEPELPQTTQNAGRSARLTREQPLKNIP